MRALLQPQLLVVTVPAGAVLALACVPLILTDTPAGTLRGLQLVALPVLCTVLLQAAFAWTPRESRRLPGGPPDASAWRWFELALLAALVSASRAGSDLWLHRLLFIPEIRDWGTFWRKLPFAGLVQPLFLVVGVCAFAARLSRRMRLTLAAVVLVHQGVVALQFGRLLDAVPLAGLVGLAGAHGLLAALAYERYGLCGPAVLAVVGFARHAVYLLWPASAP